MPARTAKSCEAPQTGLFCSLFPGTSPGLAATTTQALRELRARTASVGEVSLSQFGEFWLSPGHHLLEAFSRALPPRSQHHASGSMTGNPGRLSLRHRLWVWQPQERLSSPKLSLQDPQKHRLLARSHQIQPKQPAMPWQVAEAGSSWRCPVSDGFPQLVAQMLCRINPHTVTCFFAKY